MVARKPNSSRNLVTSITRNLVDGCSLIEITHEGYGESYGLTHNRNLQYQQMEPIYEEKAQLLGAPGSFLESGCQISPSSAC